MYQRTRYVKNVWQKELIVTGLAIYIIFLYEIVLSDVCHDLSVALYLSLSVFFLFVY